MNKIFALSFIFVFISQFVSASENLCFNPDQITGDSISLKLKNLSRMIENDMYKKGINCVFNGIVVPNKLSILAYKEQKGICASELRACKEGTLSGNYAYTHCEAPANNSAKSVIKSAPASR